jgi:hypothetical protein
MHTELAPLTSTELVGYYELGEVNVPVFEHTRKRFDDLVGAYLRGSRAGGRRAAPARPPAPHHHLDRRGLPAPSSSSRCRRAGSCHRRPDPAQAGGG